MNPALFIPIELLEEFSDDNFNKLNRSIDVKLLKQTYPDISGVISPFNITHNHAFGVETEQHYRLIIDCVMIEGGDILHTTLTQDITKEQMDILQELKRDILADDEEVSYTIKG